MALPLCDSSCGCSKETHSRWIGCYASAGLFCFGLELSEAVYAKQRLVHEICTQTTTLTGRL